MREKRRKEKHWLEISVHVMRRTPYFLLTTVQSCVKDLTQSRTRRSSERLASRERGRKKITLQIAPPNRTDMQGPHLAGPGTGISRVRCFRGRLVTEMSSLGKRRRSRWGSLSRMAAFSARNFS